MRKIRVPNDKVIEKILIQFMPYKDEIGHLYFRDKWVVPLTDVDDEQFEPQERFDSYSGKLKENMKKNWYRVEVHPIDKTRRICGYYQFNKTELFKDDRAKFEVLMRAIQHYKFSRRLWKQMDAYELGKIKMEDSNGTNCAMGIRARLNIPYIPATLFKDMIIPRLFPTKDHLKELRYGANVLHDVAVPICFYGGTWQCKPNSATDEKKTYSLIVDHYVDEETDNVLFDIMLYRVIKDMHEIDKQCPDFNIQIDLREFLGSSFCDTYIDFERARNFKGLDDYIEENSNNANNTTEPKI